MPPKKTTKPAAAKPAAKAPLRKAGASKPAAGKGKGEGAAAAAAEPPKAEAPLMGTTIGLKAFNTALFTPDNELGQSGRWPFVTDPSERSATFLRYRDVNMLNAMNQADMGPDRIRLALIGGLRFGKPIVVDFMQSDLTEMWPKVAEFFNAVKPGLMDNILDRTILKEDYFKTLIKEEDDNTVYGLHFFSEDVVNRFSFIAVTATEVVPKDIARMFYTVNVE